MSLHEYQTAIELNLEDTPFYAYIMAAMMRADTVNAAKLRLVFPETWDELEKRYHARGGMLPGD